MKKFLNVLIISSLLVVDLRVEFYIFLFDDEEWDNDSELRQMKLLTIEPNTTALLLMMSFFKSLHLQIGAFLYLLYQFSEIRYCSPCLLCVSFIKTLPVLH